MRVIEEWVHWGCITRVPFGIGSSAARSLPILSPMPPGPCRSKCAPMLIRWCVLGAPAPGPPGAWPTAVAGCPLLGVQLPASGWVAPGLGGLMTGLITGRMHGPPSHAAETPMGYEARNKYSYSQGWFD